MKKAEVAAYTLRIGAFLPGGRLVFARAAFLGMPKPAIERQLPFFFSVGNFFDIAFGLGGIGGPKSITFSHWNCENVCWDTPKLSKAFVKNNSGETKGMAPVKITGSLPTLFIFPTIDLEIGKKKMAKDLTGKQILPNGNCFLGTGIH